MTVLLCRPLSHGLRLVVAGLRSLLLANRLKSWLKATRGLRQLMAASHGLEHHWDLVQTSFIVAYSISYR